jgi:hypothetical protein
VITFITGLNQCAIVICTYAVMVVSSNEFFLFEKVLLLASIKFTCYAELGAVVHARKTQKLIYITSNIQDSSCSCNQVRIELKGIEDTMKLRLAYCIGLRINPLRHDGIIFQETLRKTSNYALFSVANIACMWQVIATLVR